MISSASSQRLAPPQAISITNFDLSALYLLRPEIQMILDNCEKHLSEFYNDKAQAPLLLDSAAMLAQLGSVFKLISLYGSSELAHALSAGFKHLYDHGDNSKKALILSLLEAIMIQARYVEFVLLQETLEPSLLLPIINKINGLLGHSLISETAVSVEGLSGYQHIILANPAQNFQPVAKLGLNHELLTTAYRAGLAVVLSAKTSKLTDSERDKISAMHQACTVIADQSDSLFWRAAQVATQHLAELLPLQPAQKRLFIFIDQQFNTDLPTDNRRFAELVSFACLQPGELAGRLRQQVTANKLSDSQLKQFKQFLHGPDQKITGTIHTLIQQQINDIKADIDAQINVSLSADGSEQPVVPKFHSATDKLAQLASIFQLLNLPKAAQSLQNSIHEIGKWHLPNDEQLDILLSQLMVAENAAIGLSKAHIPGAAMQRINNANISIYQLDTAYQQLIKQSRRVIRQLEQAIGEYLDSLYASNTNASVQPQSLLQQIPATLKQLAGALQFLALSDAANMINRLRLQLDESLYIDDNKHPKKQEQTYDTFANLATVLLAIDHQLSARQQNYPIGQYAMQVANSSLAKVLAA